MVTAPPPSTTTAPPSTTPTQRQGPTRGAAVEARIALAPTSRTSTASTTTRPRRLSRAAGHGPIRAGSQSQAARTVAPSQRPRVITAATLIGVAAPRRAGDPPAAASARASSRAATGRAATSRDHWAASQSLVHGLTADPETVADLGLGQALVGQIASRPAGRTATGPQREHQTGAAPRPPGPRPGPGESRRPAGGRTVPWPRPRPGAPPGRPGRVLPADPPASAPRPVRCRPRRATYPPA